MKKLLCFFMVFCICMSISIGIQADTYFEYTTDGNNAIITGLKPKITGLSSLKIPSKVDGFTVVGIGDEAFSERYFDSITIPDTVESIGYMCFFGTRVQEGQKIYIPKSVKEIGTYAFSYMSGVENFEVHPENAYYTSEDGILFSKDKKILLNYPLSKKDEIYFLPAETELLYCTSFGNCTNLKKLVLQNNKVTRMGYTFFGCDMTIYGDPDCYTRLWMDRLTEKNEYGKVKYGGSYPLTEPVNDSRSKVEAFVKRLYNIALNREADPEGLSFFTDRLKSKEFTAAYVIQHILLDAPEFLSKNHTNEEFVEICYRSFFDRPSDPEGKAFWLDKLDEGYSRRWIMANMLNAPTAEFDNLCKAAYILTGKIDIKAADYPREK